MLEDDDVDEIHVCLARTCASRGSEAVLAEIEELAAAVGGCEVYGIGCLGACSEAPNALVRMRSTGDWPGQSKVHMRINSLEASVEVVKQATGKKVPLQEPEVKERLKKLRADRALKQALAVYHWSAALSWGLDADDPEVTKAILGKAGFPGWDLQGAGAAVMPAEIENYVLWSVEEVVPVSRAPGTAAFSSSRHLTGSEGRLILAAADEACQNPKLGTQRCLQRRGAIQRALSLGSSVSIPQSAVQRNGRRGDAASC